MINLSDFQIYIGNDPLETFNLLKNKNSPIVLINNKDKPPYFFNPSINAWNNLILSDKQTPLITYSKPDNELLYLMEKESIEQKSFKQIGFNPQSELDFTCEDIVMTAEEKSLLIKIIKYLGNNNQSFSLIGEDWNFKNQKFICGYNPQQKELYTLNKHNIL